MQIIFSLFFYIRSSADPIRVPKWFMGRHAIAHQPFQGHDFRKSTVRFPVHQKFAVNKNAELAGCFRGLQQYAIEFLSECGE